MNREDVIRMARDAGKHQWPIEPEFLERFAQAAYAAGAAAEREKVAAWMHDHSYATGHGDTTEDLLKELDWQIRESEREACAQVCESDDSMWWAGAAEAIRARGNKT